MKKKELEKLIDFYQNLSLRNGRRIKDLNYIDKMYFKLVILQLFIIFLLIVLQFLK